MTRRCPLDTRTSITLAIAMASLAVAGCAGFQPPTVEAPSVTVSRDEGSSETDAQPDTHEPGEWAPRPAGPGPDTQHGPLVGVVGSRRFVPALRTEVLGLQLGYHFLVGSIDHALTLTGGLAFESGNCGDGVSFDGRLSYSFLHRFARWLVTGGEVGVWGFEQRRCHATAERREAEIVRDVVSLAWLFGAHVDPLVFGLSVRGGVGPWENPSSVTDGGIEDAGGTSFTVDLEAWVQLRF